MNIKVNLDTNIRNGTEIVFRSPKDCSEVSGLIVYYKNGGLDESKGFSFADAHRNNLGNIDHLFSKGAVVKVILDVTNSMAFIYNANTNTYLENRFGILESKLDNIDVSGGGNNDSQNIYTATPETLIHVIKSAKSGSVINLTEGNYNLLNLYGQDSYTAENLTIYGGNVATIAGVSITSGVKSDSLHGSGDVSNAILPQGLTFKDITFVGVFSQRNSRIDNLTIDGCTFKDGAYIKIDPECFEDIYGNDRKSPAPDEGEVDTRDQFASTYRFPYAHLKQKNLVIRDCILRDTSTEGLRESAICVLGVEGMDIFGNTIECNQTNGGFWNGIQVGGYITDYSVVSSGNISITGNNITHTMSRALNIHSINNGDITVAGNTIVEVSHAEKIRIQNCKEVVLNWTINGPYSYLFYNTSDGSQITVGSGIVIYNSVILKDFLNTQPRTYIFSPYDNIIDTSRNLADTIMSAEPGSTIKLTKGSYNLLLLTTSYVKPTYSDFWGTNYKRYHDINKDKNYYEHYALVTKFPENLTIMGEEGVVMNGLCVTSGVDFSAGPGTLLPSLPKGLTIKNIYFTDNLYVRNCEWDGLNIIGCTFSPESSIMLKPNYYGSNKEYGAEGGGGKSPRLGTYETMLHNVVIKDCIFESSDVRNTAIDLYSIDGAEIINNIIDGGKQSGVYISTQSMYPPDVQYKKSCGRLVVSKNKISNITGTTSIPPAAGVSFFFVNDATIQLQDNILSEIASNALFAKDCKYVDIECINNTYDGSTTDIVKAGVVVSHEQRTDNPHGITKDVIGLGNVDNTSDLNKPISTKTQAALDKKINVGDITFSLSNGTLYITTK